MTGTMLEEEGFHPDYEEFKAGFQALTGIQLGLYKQKQMLRRIRTLMARKGIADFPAFLSRLKSDPKELASFVDYITINVTEFFRTPEQWSVFEETVLADLLSRKTGPLKIWSCACSTGEEPYSLAMSLLNYTVPSEFHILATDLDEAVLKKARDGVFEERCMDSLPQDLRDRYFTANGNQWVLKDAVRSCVEFRRLDLLREEYPTDVDLIVCRNVLIYFTEEGKEKIYRQFHSSLKPGGYLFTGNTEQIIYYRAFNFKKMKNYIYYRE